MAWYVMPWSPNFSYQLNKFIIFLLERQDKEVGWAKRKIEGVGEKSSPFIW